MAIRELRETGTIEAALARAPAARPGAELWWLGQAGFVVRTAGRTLLIDPYLSDSLAKKYAGKIYPHIRAMPAPLSPAQARGIDAVLCTHRHSDHMDPGTLPDVAALNPPCIFVVPKAARERALEIGLPDERIAGMADGDRLLPFEGISIEALPSAHEERKRNERGEDEFLGYILRAGGVALYHSGDCVPYPGLRERLAGLDIDAALLPINGRDERRRSNGIPGNFTFREAVELSGGAGIPSLICHHFGMFDFNTADLVETRTLLKEMRPAAQVLFAQVGVRYRVEGTPSPR
jgi:L-ascorbate metabolism protein UlaG (beta-lactamase superfamily)